MFQCLVVPTTSTSCDQLMCHAGCLMVPKIQSRVLLQKGLEGSYKWLSIPGQRCSNQTAEKLHWVMAPLNYNDCLAASHYRRNLIINIVNTCDCTVT